MTSATDADTQTHRPSEHIVRCVKNCTSDRGLVLSVEWAYNAIKMYSSGLKDKNATLERLDKLMSHIDNRKKFLASNGADKFGNNLIICVDCCDIAAKHIQHCMHVVRAEQRNSTCACYMAN